MSKPRGTNRSWREQQERDPYVQQARRQGWRSRAVYKLKQIDERENLLRRNLVCIDLGAAPGGWSQYVVGRLQGEARVIAIDLLPMEPIAGVDVVQGDFTEARTLAGLQSRLGGRKAGLVMSDMAPNLTGNRAVDQPRAMYLAELALDFARNALDDSGDFVCKLFQGEGFEEFLRDTRSSFARVKVNKPKASRAGSREVYLVARNYRL